MTSPVAHPHVERPVHAIAEPAGGRVELHRRHSQVEEDPLQRPRGFGLSDLGEASMSRREAVAVAREALASDPQSLLVAIEPMTRSTPASSSASA